MRKVLKLLALGAGTTAGLIAAATLMVSQNAGAATTLAVVVIHPIINGLLNAIVTVIPIV